MISASRGRTPLYLHAAVLAWALVSATAVPAPAPAPPPGSGGDAPAPALAGEQKLRYGPFGEVVLYHPQGAPRSVVLFISGDGGWNLGVVDMARHLLDMQALVVGIDIRTYLKAVNAKTNSCRSFAADFEGLAHEVERRAHLRDYLPPTIVGYSSGATLAYATVVQSPKGTFAGAMSLGFCPDLAMTQNICKSNGLSYDVDYGKNSSAQIVKGVLFKQATHNTTPWAVFQGDADQVCEPTATRSFAAGTSAAELVWLPKVGHGFSVERNWLPQFRATFAKLTARAAPLPVTLPEVRDLPLVEVPAAAAVAETADEFAVILTGDGGWAGLDQDVAGALAARGVPVVGLSTLKYFWTARTPEVAAADLARIIERYSVAWKRPKALLIGYSFGADVLPFLYTRLPTEQRESVRSVNLLGLSDTATFEFHVADWIPGSDGAGRPTAPEVARMHGATVLCLYGAEESDSPCPKLVGPGVTAVPFAGGHHFGGDYAALATQILAHARH